jgi:MFS family permease
LPTVVFSIGEAALIPTIPANASNLGSGLALAGFIAGLFMIGTMLTDLPAAKLVHKIGERQAMIYSGLFASFGGLLAALTDSLLLLGLSVFLVGCGHAVFALARHSFITAAVPASHRGRALSTLGGMFRLGGFIGPLLGAAVISFIDLHGVYWLALSLFALAAFILLFFAKDDRDQTAGQGEFTIWSTITENRRNLLTLGIPASLLAALRTLRGVGLPLWGTSIGLTPAEVSLFLGIAAAIDLALFYTSGQIMDRFGRRWVAIPSLVGMSLAQLLIFLAVDGPTFLAIALFMALSNGIGSGLVLLLGADMAPAAKRSEFLAAYRLLIDSSAAAAPLGLAIITASLGLTAGLGFFGLIGMAGAVMFGRYLPKRLA